MREAAQDLAGRAVVVTGVGKSGQAGEVVARAFAMRGAVVHCVGRGDETSDRVRELTVDGLDAVAHRADLSDFEVTRSLAQRIAAQHEQKIEAVAALAGGFGGAVPVADLTAGQLRDQLSINLFTAISTAQAFVPAVRNARGTLVFVASAAALPDGSPKGIAAYAAAKSGVVQLVKALAREEEEHGVRVFGVAPVAIRTAENVASMGGARRYIEREDFAAAIMALCEGALAHASGQVLRLA